jgi:hypothetical protein
MVRLGRLRGAWLVIAALVLLPMLQGQDASRGRKYKPPPPTCKISVTVVRATDGKPVEDAAVVFHPIKDGKDEGNLELKTDEDGKAVINVIPIGDTVRVQVIADGYQTYGNEYELPTDSKEIAVKLSRPARQYSIYENHPDQSGSNQQGSGQSGSGSGQSGSQSSPPPQQGSQDTQKPPQ